MGDAHRASVSWMACRNPLPADDDFLKAYFSFVLAVKAAADKDRQTLKNIISNSHDSKVNSMKNGTHDEEKAKPEEGGGSVFCVSR